MHSIACRVAIIALLLSVATAGGCGLQDLILGKQGAYFLNTYDTLALPGEEVAATARLFGGNPIHDLENVPIIFSHEGRELGRAMTDREGFARVAFVPSKPGDYLVTATVAEGALSHTPPPPAQAWVSCRRSDAPLLLVDLDKTLVASGTRQVLVGQPQPLPRSQAAMAGLAKDFSIIYLTQRPDCLGPKSRAWLGQHEFPSGPVLLATLRGAVENNRDYKTRVISDLRQRFTGRAWGIGDKTSDAQAYVAGQVKPLLLVILSPKADAADLRQAADALRSLPSGTQVVTDWDQVEAVIAGRTTSSPARVQVILRQQADQLGRTPRQRKPEL